jgi:hypothetical protein
MSAPSASATSPAPAVTPPSASAPASPQPAYRERLARWGEVRRRAKRGHDLLAWARLLALLGLVAIAYERCGSRGGSNIPVLVALAVVVGLSMAVSRAAAAMARASEAELYYQAGLARLAGSWEVVVSDGRAFEPPQHLFAADLDLFGPQSLFARLCTARTEAGQRRLAQWLCAAAPAQEVRARQEAVAELRDLPDLREELWRAAGTVNMEVRAAPLEGWLAAPPTDLPLWPRLVAPLLALAGLGAIAALVVAGHLAWAFGMLVVDLLFTQRYKHLVAEVGLAVQHRADELKAVAALAALMEGRSFTGARLRGLQESLRSGALPARRAVLSLSRRVEWFESRRNAFYALLSAPLMVTTQLAFAIEAWRRRHGSAASGWLQAIGELEALSSLATYAFEHPEQPFPEIVADEDGPLFEGRALAHPLLPAEARVGNDVSLDRTTRLWLVTGSNMSGKSTLLRTVGTAAVMALAGAPVVAQRLRLSRLAIGATLRTSDSLQAGVSRFFAEIQRLRGIVALSEASPLTMFLLDEILHGTNSQDRLAGATAIVQALVARGSIGLVTTHDLVLARIVDQLGTTARNVHFEDVIEEGHLSFDYQLRPGVVSRGNAIALMKLVGLPV